MSPYLRRILPIFLLLTASVLIVELPSLLNRESATTATVFVQVYQGGDTSILSFNSDFPDPNLIVSSKSFPSDVRAETMSISSDGRWLFATGIPNGHNYFPLAYTRVGQPFTNPQLYDYKAMLSADEQTLFYTSIDSAGLRETYNFLDLASGQRVELLSVPLPNAGTIEGMKEYIVPVAGWMPGDQPFIFTAYQGDMATGLYQIDLSGIDFTKSGQYPMPQAIRFMAFDRDVGGAIFSPDKKSILYFQADSQGQSVSYRDAHVSILTLETGSVQTIPEENGDTIGRVEWRPNGTLLYLTQGDNEHSFQIYAYDPIRQQSQRLPLTLAGNGSNSFDAAICGNTLFYTASAPDTFRSMALYSARLDAPVHNQLLYVADSISINSCAPDSSWNPGKVAARTDSSN